MLAICQLHNYATNPLYLATAIFELFCQLLTKYICRIHVASGIATPEEMVGTICVC